jgi:hypothetical protein
MSLAFKQTFASASRLTINPTSYETDSSGDLGFDSGQYEETVVTGLDEEMRKRAGRTLFSIPTAVAPAGNVTASGLVTMRVGGTQSIRRGSYLVVLKRQAGKWLIVQQATTEISLTGK